MAQLLSHKEKSAKHWAYPEAQSGETCADWSASEQSELFQHSIVTVAEPQINTL